MLSEASYSHVRTSKLLQLQYNTRVNKPSYIPSLTATNVYKLIRC